MNSFFIFIFQLFLISIIKCETIYDVTKFGADIKGITKSTEAVKKAIDEAFNKGGGTVYFPNGEYLCGPIHLKSNITLHLADNAIIKFSKDFDDYLPMIRIRWEGTELMSFSPLIYAYKQQNIGITGKGVLDGQGKYWWDFYNKLKEEYANDKKRDTKYQMEFLKVNNLTNISAETVDMGRIDLGFLRPPFIQPFDSKNILIQDIHIKNSPFWNINPVYCEDVTIKGVKIEAPVPSPNTDGIDPDSCKNVYISKVVIDVGDDCIAIKAGRDLQARRIGRPTENVTIVDSHMLRGHSGVAIGSEMSGSVRNVTVRNCIFNGTDKGLAIKTARGRGGVVENINFQNISMTDIKKEAILISLLYAPSSKSNKTGPEPFSDRTPTVHKIEFKDIRGTSKNSIVLAGLPESIIDSIKISNFSVKSKNSFALNYTKNVEINGKKENNSKFIVI